MIDTSHSLLLIGVMAGCTAFLRFLPFALFSKGTPKIVLYLGDVLPYAMIGMLVVYCLKSVPYGSFSDGAKQLIAAAAVVILHLLKRNTLLSIGGGTALYMLLLRL